ncbi:TPA: ASCH domain-containing protein [Neisseria lactamica]
MKALSVRQPYAFLIGNCEKSIELRSWKTDYRGDLLICASKSEKDAWVILGYFG